MVKLASPTHSAINKRERFPRKTPQPFSSASMAVAFADRGRGEVGYLGPERKGKARDLNFAVPLYRMS